MARLRKRGPPEDPERYLELIWTDSAGKSRTESLGRASEITKKDAELIRRTREREVLLAKHGVIAPVAPTFKQWSETYLRWHKAEYPDSHFRVQQIVEDHLATHFDHHRLDAITEDDIEDLKTVWRVAKFKDHTVTKMLRTTSAIFNRAVAKKIIAANPAALVVPPQILDAKPHVWYDADAMQKLYAECKKDWHASAWKLFANTGMRRGEGAQQRRCWVGSDGMKIVSTGEERTKSGEWRDVPLFTGAREAVELLDDLLGKGRDHLFPEVNLVSLSRAAARCIDRAKLPGSLHTLRHTFICNLAKDPTVPIRSIQRWAGHATIATTEKYMYLRSDAGGADLTL